MEDQDSQFVSDEKISESIRLSYAQTLGKEKEIEQGNKLEARRIELEAKKFVWDTPVVAALAGLITLSAIQLSSRAAYYLPICPQGTGIVV